MQETPSSIVAMQAYVVKKAARILCSLKLYDFALKKNFLSEIRKPEVKLDHDVPPSIWRYYSATAEFQSSSDSRKFEGSNERIRMW